MEGILGADFSGKGYIIISRVERTKGRCCNGTNIKKDSFNSLLIVFFIAHNVVSCNLNTNINLASIKKEYLVI